MTDDVPDTLQIRLPVAMSMVPSWDGLGAQDAGIGSMSVLKAGGKSDVRKV